MIVQKIHSRRIRLLAFSETGHFQLILFKVKSKPWGVKSVSAKHTFVVLQKFTVTTSTNKTVHSLQFGVHLSQQEMFFSDEAFGRQKVNLRGKNKTESKENFLNRAQQEREARQE